MDFESITFFLAVLLIFTGRQGVIVFIHFAIYQIISITKLYEIGASYYVLAALIDFSIFVLAVRYHLNLLIMAALSFSIIYNAVSFIEYNTEYLVIYNLYSQIQSVLAVSLLIGAAYGWIINLFGVYTLDHLDSGERLSIGGSQ